MARLARMVVSGLPHHVTQRGNPQEAIFFEDGDQEIYRDLLGEQAGGNQGLAFETWDSVRMAVGLIPQRMQRMLAHGVAGRTSSAFNASSRLIKPVPAFAGCNKIRRRRDKTGRLPIQ